ncbi:MAG: M15 family metallopeptidase [Eggerthellaceae bacterium]|nr:M15 family metallopeptidase [Eggerthellaceae bacterium]
MPIWAWVLVCCCLFVSVSKVACAIEASDDISRITDAYIACGTTVGNASLRVVPPCVLPVQTVVDEKYINRYGIEDFFTVQPIPDSVFERMDGVTFPSDCPVTRGELRYIRLLHVDAEGNVKVGEMVVNEAIADDVASIFKQLYEAQYPIESVRLACDYGGDDELSMEANNTSAFNCRPIEGTGEQSRHSYGMAVDVNPLYNPYVMESQGLVLPVTAGEYANRSIVTEYTMFEGDLCWQLFTSYGFVWGGSWAAPIDYQHFER